MRRTYIAVAVLGALVGLGVPRHAAAAACTGKPEVRLLHWAWNAQMGLMHASGAAQVLPESLMCRAGVNLKLMRQDDVGKMQENLIVFATDLKGGEPHPKKGAHFVVIMGDGAASFLKGLNDALKRLGPEYTAKVVGSLGSSQGEDKFMGPPAWKATPAASKGGLVAGVLRDGDWNIAQKWLGDNKLCTNPNEKTYDPDCLNWVAASDYLDAGEKYIAGYCEERPVVSKGTDTGQKKKVCVDSVVTWTPGDVNIATKKGGLVSIVSTKEYKTQMPAVVIGIDKWMRDNRATVESFLGAAFEGASRVKASPQVLRRAAEVSAAVYKEAGAGADYWEKYFVGVTEKDKQGLMVELGGSSVYDLADNQVTFGLKPGSTNFFAATYTIFGDIAKAQYPDLLPGYPPVAEILDTSYLEGLARKSAK
jgi:OmpA-OmpF porin, OOP family